MRPQRRGVTLIELVVVLAIIGIMAAVTGLSMQTAAPVTYPDPTIAQLAHLRDSAITSGRSITTTIMIHDRATAVTAFSDGRVLSKTNIVERTTGRAPGRAHALH